MLPIIYAYFLFFDKNNEKTKPNSKADASDCADKATAISRLSVNDTKTINIT